LNDPVTNKRIDTFEDIRTWKFQTKKGTDGTFLDCNANTFGGDELKGERHQCWCEPKPVKVPTTCADEGEECLCNGYVFYGAKYNVENET